MNSNIIIYTVFGLLGTAAAGYAVQPTEPPQRIPTVAAIERKAAPVNPDEEAKNEIIQEQKEYEAKTQPPQETKQEGVDVTSQTQEKPEPVAVVQPMAAVVSSVRTRSFRMNNGTYQTGQQIIDYGMSNPNARKLWDAFNAKYGNEVADTALITLFFENGTFLETTTGVCNPKYQINGDYRNCVYADINSAGMDAGLKQINTFYQRYRIAKLGGPQCEPQNSRDITDPCTASQVRWLHNVDNNITIALDIYSESGFTPWYGYKRAFNK